MSLQLPGAGSSGPSRHIASGALREDNLVLVPNMSASVLQHEGPYLAVLVEQFGDAPAPWESPDEKPFPDLPVVPVEGLGVPDADVISLEEVSVGVISVQCIRCSCEEAHGFGGDTFHVAFRLEVPYTGDRRPIYVDKLLNTPQDAVWPEAEEVLRSLSSTPHGIPLLSAPGKTVAHHASSARSSWCRLVPWC